jgi:membrane-bound metal-dependent hydrolase YbcI (DUF457 family)
MSLTPGAAQSRSRRALLPAYALVVPALAGLGGLAFLAAKPGVARSMAGSPRALGFTLAVAALVLAATWLLPRRRVRPAVTVLAQLVPATVAFVVAVLPAFHQVTVVEAFPDAASAPPGTAAPSALAPAADRADVVARAALHGIDHDATGTALLVRRADGSSVVRLQALDVEPGPDYQLHLLPGRDRTWPGGGVHLGRLRGNRGAQNYDVPAGAPVDGPVTVLVWCRAFGVPVAAATLG